MNVFVATCVLFFFLSKLTVQKENELSIFDLPQKANFLLKKGKLKAAEIKICLSLWLIFLPSVTDASEISLYNQKLDILHTGQTHNPEFLKGSLLLHS